MEYEMAETTLRMPTTFGGPAEVWGVLALFSGRWP